MEKLKDFVKRYNLEILILLAAVIFSSWLMFATFSYEKGAIEISSKAWSDFANHIPLIRSFSLGNNFPPQYPLFAGPPIKYHFLFYAFTGFIEKTGIRIDYALNIPSILGFSLLILMIYLFAKEIFKSKAVGIMSVLFFIFNGSLDFINFFNKFPLSKNTVFDIIRNTNFISFGPYDGKIISAFWNLNIYTNQRHLALSFALSLLIIYIFLRIDPVKKSRNLKISAALGIILGISFILNIAVFLMSACVLSCMLIFMSRKRLCIFATLIIAAVIAFPQYAFMQQGVSTSGISLYPGYLVTNLTLFNFFNYWFQNLGLHLILIPLGFLLAPKKARKILISFFALFIIGNLIKFSPEIAANHKFFNYFMIVGSMFSSYFLYFLWEKKNILKPIVLIVIFFLILSGIIDLFPIYNDNYISLNDYRINKDANWILNNTSPDSVFLNTQFLYDNASIVGRKIYLGWPYFAWSQGYDTDARYKSFSQILGAENKQTLCPLLIKSNIDYIEISGNNLGDSNLPKISNIFNTLKPTYQDLKTNYSIYKTSQNCENI
jgi:hypothetical protein